MPSLTELSAVSTSSLTPQGSANYNAISSVLAMLGWQDARSEITQADEIDRDLADKLQADYAHYLNYPYQSSIDNLNASLNAVIDKLEKNREITKQCVKEVNERLNQKPVDDAQKEAGLFAGLTAKFKSLFGSDDLAVLKHYEQLTAQYNTQLQQLSNLRNSLHGTVADELETTNKHLHHERRLLQTTNFTFPTTNEQFCYSTLGCDLRDLLDGVLGFSLQGKNINGYEDALGSSVSPAGDVNGDGIADIIIGAPGAWPYKTGSSFVIFGSRNRTAWGNGVLDIRNLINGKQGFVLQGEVQNEASGTSVSTAGDLNGDGISDVIVGTNSYPQPGCAYVVFGSRNSTAWGNGILNLSNLMDGQRGFVLQGASDDSNRWSVSTAGDINGDGVSDIIVGVPPKVLSSAGKSYVVFGSNLSTAWGSGVLDLAGLMNGQRGFVLQGALGDRMGVSVSAAGDVNGDGIVDIIVGEDYALSRAGKSYVVFGSRNTTSWGNGSLSVSNLTNGQRGVVFQGETADDYSGGSVSTIGDINKDGVTDLIVGAFGKSYVVFGSKNSSLWGSGILNLSSLTDGQRGFLLYENYVSPSSVSTPGDVDGDGISDIIVSMGKTYVVFGTENRSAWGNGKLSLDDMMNSQRGFALESTYGADVSTAGDINGDGMSDILVGVSLSGAGGASYVVFGQPGLSTSLYFTANHLRISGAQNVLITPQNLAVSSSQTNINGNITRFTVQNLSHGTFATLAAPTTPLFVFYMQNVSDGQIQFRHDGTLFAPQYRISAINSQAQNSPLISVYSDAQIDFLGHPPKLAANSLSVNQYGTVLIQSEDLAAIDPDNTDSELFFTIHNLTYGQFRIYNITTNLTAPTLRFSQQNIIDGSVQFVQDGSRNVPSYTVTVSDFRSTTVDQAANITFRYAPVVNFKPAGLIIDQDRATTLTWQDIDAKGAESFPGSLLIEVENVTHGHFAYSNSPNDAITVFQRLFLITSTVQFIQDGSVMTPNFTLRAFDGLYTPWQVPFIQLNHRPLAHGNPDAQSVVQDEDFSFTLLPNLFSDPDANDTLTYHAQLVGGAPLPLGVEFDSSQRQFLGKLPTVSSFIIEVQASDKRGLTASTHFVLSSTESKAAYYRSIYGSLSGIGGIGITVLAYLWLRRRIALHRREFPLVNDLRKVLNLEYYDFTRFAGDAFKTKVNDLLQRFQLEHQEFYSQLSPEERKSFAVCVAEILIARELVSRSGYGGGLFGILCCLNVGWPSQLNMKQFEQQSGEIAIEAIATWKHHAGYKLASMSELSEDKPKEKNTIYIDMEDNVINYTVIDPGVKRGGEKGSIKAEELGLRALPTTVDGLNPHLPKMLEITLARGHTQTDKALKQWPYHSPTMKEKAKVFFCCAKPSSASFFAPKRRFMPGVELEELKKHSAVDSEHKAGQQRSSGFEARVLSFMETMNGKVNTMAQQIEDLEEARSLLAPRK